MADDEIIAQEQPADTRREQIADAINALEPQVTAQPDAKPDRARDEAGKFAPADKAAPAKPGPKAAPQAQQAAPDAVQEPVWKRPPQSWKKDYHDAWLTADPRLQEYAYQREEQMKAGVQPLLTKAEYADSVSQVVEPYMATIKGLGYTVPQVIKGFFEADNILRTAPPQQKLAYLVQLAQNYGVDLRSLTGVASQAPAVDPNYHALLNEMNKVRGEVRTWQEQQEAAQNQVLSSEIVQFAQQHEHFETVKPAMVALLQSGQAANLDEAYKKAVRLDDTLFESTVQARQAETIAGKDKAAKSARAAAVSVRGSAPGSHTATKAQGRRAMLEEAFSGVEPRL